jgi:putative endonuclease
MTDTPNTIALGQQAEQHAISYLLDRGLTLIDKNYRCPLGEIDLIMRDHKEIVFIEVRLRNNQAFADGIDSVTLAKQKKIIKTAHHFLAKHNLYDKVNCRFDIIGLCYQATQINFVWIADAFSADNF